MKYEFDFYKEEYYDDIEKLILASYRWEAPAFGISRFSFSHGLHPKFCGITNAWQKSCAVYKENGAVVAAVMNEGNDCGDAFFLFDSEDRTADEELLYEMIAFAKMYASTVDQENDNLRFSGIMVPSWNKTLRDCVTEKGYLKEDYTEKAKIKPFGMETLPVVLPEGYSFADGNDSPAIFRAMVHANSFSYGLQKGAHKEDAFEELRKEKNYDPDLDLIILDAQKRPVAMAIIWVNSQMRYCELEPLGVVWWERRKGLASAILNEATNRVKKKYKNCSGMLGGDQPFYTTCGYETVGVSEAYRWEAQIFPSWDERSKDMKYGQSI